MKRQNLLPGAFALNYLLSFNNKLHTSKTEAAQMSFLGETKGCCDAVPGPWLLQQPLGMGNDVLREDGLGKEGKINPLYNVSWCSIQMLFTYLTEGKAVVGMIPSLP